MDSRADFLSDESHRIRFVYIPKYKTMRIFPRLLLTLPYAFYAGFLLPIHVAKAETACVRTPSAA